MAKRRRAFNSDDEDDKKKISFDGLKKTLRLFKFMMPYKGWLFVGMLFMALSFVTSFSFPMFMGKIVDAIVGDNKQLANEAAQTIQQNSGGGLSGMNLKTQLFDGHYTINQIVVVLIAVLILQGIFSFLRIYLFSKASENTLADIRRTVYQKIISLPISFFEKNRVGELTSRLSSDITQLSDIMTFTFAEFFRQFFTFVFGILFLLWLSWKLSLFMLATIPVAVVATMFFGRYIGKLSRSAQDRLAEANVIVEETLQGVNVVKAFTNERYEVNRYQSALGNVVDTAMKAATFRGSFVSFVIMTLFGGIVGVVWYGAGLVQSGEMRFAELFTFIIYTMFIGGSVGGLGEVYAQIRRTVGASERILEILGEESEVKFDANQQFNKVKGNISFQNVGFSYPSRADVRVLKDISIDIKAGEKIALVGQSGAGKSTIVQLLMKLYNIDTGKIAIDGQNIDNQDVSQLRYNLAIVPQEVMLFGGTIYENIAYGKPNATEAEIIEAARKANALDFIESFPEKLQTVVGERGVKLSGGQRQRIAIARAILKDPAILILDEATSALDSESERLVQDALDELMKNRTTIIIAHRLATIRNVDKIYVLKNGEIAESGNHEELILKDDGIYANLVKLQVDSMNLVME
ncbi:MAG: ABC transporter ATP-binding protein [Spirosomataceae bacterium]